MKLIKVAALALILSSCAKTQVKINKSKKFDNPNWTRIEIPDGGEATAMFGDLDDTLVVSTATGFYQTVNQGETWVRTKENHQPVFGFIVKPDTVFALFRNSLLIPPGPRIASVSTFFSLDYGSTWKDAALFNVSKKREQEYAVVHPTDQVTVKLKENLQPIDGDVNYNAVLKSDIEVSRSGVSQILALPFNNQITNLNLDKKGRLYVSATNGLYDKETGKYVDYEKGRQSIIYISKQNILKLINQQI